MIPAVTAPACQVFGISEKITLATRMIAEISIMLRTKRAVFRYRGGSSTILRTRCAPGLPSSTSRLARALENDDRAASAAAVNPAKIISTKAMPSWSQVGLGHHEPPGTVRTLHGPRRDDLVGETEHLRLLLRLCVVVPKQVQQPVHQQILRLLAGGASMLARLPVGHLRAQHDVAEQTTGGSSPSVGGRSSSIGKLSTSVGPGSPRYFSW